MNGKGSVQADAVFNLLEEWNIEENIIGVCTDTTASNTGRLSGAIVKLQEKLSRPLLWLMCRRHSYERHICHGFNAITGQKSKGPCKNIYNNLKSNWHKYKPLVETNMDKIRYFDYENCDPTEKKFALEAKELCQNLLEKKSFKRGDYEYLVTLCYIYLGGEVTNFKFRQPGGCHEARFMADSLYILVLNMTHGILNILNETELNQMKTLCDYIAIFHGPYFLRTSIPEKAPSLDLQLVKNLKELSNKYKPISEAVLLSIDNHLWYLSEELVILTLADDSLEDEKKDNIAKKLLTFERPINFLIQKPKQQKLESKNELADFVGEQSWFLFEILEMEEKDLVWLKFQCRKRPFYYLYNCIMNLF